MQHVRRRTGEGQFLDVSMLDSSLVLMGVGVVRKFITGDGGVGRGDAARSPRTDALAPRTGRADENESH